MELMELQVIWPSSAEKLQLLADAKAVIDKNATQPSQQGSSNSSQDHLKHELQISTPNKPAMLETENTLMKSPTDSLDNGSAMIAQMLGLQLPGVPVPADSDVGMIVDEDDRRSTMVVPRFSQDTVHPNDLVTSSQPPGTSLFAPTPVGLQLSGSTTLPIVPGQGVSDMELYGMPSVTEEQPESLVPGFSRASKNISKQEGD